MELFLTAMSCKCMKPEAESWNLLENKFFIRDRHQLPQGKGNLKHRVSLLIKFSLVAQNDENM